MADVIARRRRERDQLVELARQYVAQLSRRLPVEAAIVVGSVARGDFNVWSDVDVVVVVAKELPPDPRERDGMLRADAPGRIQPVGFSMGELEEAFRRGNPIVREAVASGVMLVGRLDSFPR